MIAERASPSAATSSEDDGQLLWIHPSRGWPFINVAEVWAFRELLFNFALRDIKVRYKQTVFGLAWVIIQPITQMAIFSIIFGRIAGLPSDGVPYAVFAFAGLVPWFYFSSTVSKMSTSLDGNMHLVTKIYFPRVILPLSVMFGTLVDFAVSLPILIGMVFYAGLGVPSSVIFLPFAMVLLLAVTFGLGLWLAALNARYRDVAIALPFVLQVGFYLTPVVFSSQIVASIVPENGVLALATVNPMFGVVDAFRWMVLGRTAFPLTPVVLSCLTATVLIISGGFYFAKTDRTMVDRI